MSDKNRGIKHLTYDPETGDRNVHEQDVFESSKSFLKSEFEINYEDLHLRSKQKLFQCVQNMIDQGNREVEEDRKKPGRISPGDISADREGVWRWLQEEYGFSWGAVS